MATPSISNSFVTSTTISSTDVNQNFTDIVNGLMAGSTWDVVVTSLETTGDLESGSTLILSGSNLAKTSAPTADVLYPNSLIKAWAMVTLGIPVVIDNGFNVDTVTFAAHTITVNFHTNMGSADYCPIAIRGETTFDTTHVIVNNLAAGSFDITLYADKTNTQDWVANDTCYFVVLGSQ